MARNNNNNNDNKWSTKLCMQGRLTPLAQVNK